MWITILGVWDEDKKSEWHLHGSQDEFFAACETLGKELAKWKQAIIVSNDSTNAVDYHVVKGFVENADEETPKHLIRVIQNEEEASPFQDYWTSYEDLFTTHETVHRKEEAKFTALCDADVVITIGGMEITYNVGWAAILAKKRLVPVGSFGGASRRLLHHLRSHGKLNNHSEFGPLNGPWTPHVMQIILHLSYVTTQPKLLIIHGHGEDCSLLKNWLSTEVKLESVSILQRKKY